MVELPPSEEENISFIDSIVKHFSKFLDLRPGQTHATFNTTYFNTVAHNKLNTFGHPVEMCRNEMIDDVGSSLKMVKFFTTFLDVA